MFFEIRLIWPESTLRNLLFLFVQHLLFANTVLSFERSSFAVYRSAINVFLELTEPVRSSVEKSSILAPEKEKIFVFGSLVTNEGSSAINLP